MVSRLRAWVLPVATGLAGLATGFHLGDRQPASPAAVDFRAPAASHDAAEPALTADDVRRVLREELAAGRASAPLPASPVAEVVTPAQAAAVSEAQSVLDTALARRTWTEADADGMRASFDKLSADQQADLLRQYALAVNQGRLVPQTERVPF